MSSRAPPATILPPCLAFVPQDLASDELEAQVRSQFVALFGPAAVPRTLTIQRWWLEPETMPTAHPNANHRLFGHPELKRPWLEGRLHLTSTETSSESPGHLDGAVKRAEVVSQMLLGAL